MVQQGFPSKIQLIVKIKILMVYFSMSITWMVKIYEPFSSVQVYDSRPFKQYLGYLNRFRSFAVYTLIIHKNDALVFLCALQWAWIIEKIWYRLFLKMLDWIFSFSLWIELNHDFLFHVRFPPSPKFK